MYLGWKAQCHSHDLLEKQVRLCNESYGLGFQLKCCMLQNQFYSCLAHFATFDYLAESPMPLGTGWKPVFYKWLKGTVIQVNLVAITNATHTIRCRAKIIWAFYTRFCLIGYKWFTIFDKIIELLFNPFVKDSSKKLIYLGLVKVEILI